MKNSNRQPTSNLNSSLLILLLLTNIKLRMKQLSPETSCQTRDRIAFSRLISNTADLRPCLSFMFPVFEHFTENKNCN